MSHAYCYTISEAAPMSDVSATFDLAFLSVRSLHGDARVRLDARHLIDPITHTIVIDAGTPVGECLNQLFVGYLRQEYGGDAFRVERVSRLPAEAQTAA